MKRSWPALGRSTKRKQLCHEDEGIPFSRIFTVRLNIYTASKLIPRSFHDDRKT